MLLTELEKTILISLYALTQSSRVKAMTEEELLGKFPVRQRRAVKKYLQELVRKKLLRKEADKRKTVTYRITDRAIGEATKIIISGARLRF
jgi:hypothetical protein